MLTKVDDNTPPLQDAPKRKGATLYEFVKWLGELIRTRNQKHAVQPRVIQFVAICMIILFSVIIQIFPELDFVGILNSRVANQDVFFNTVLPGIHSIVVSVVMLLSAICIFVLNTYRSKELYGYSLKEILNMKPGFSFKSWITLPWILIGATAIIPYILIQYKLNYIFITFILICASISIISIINIVTLIYPNKKLKEIIKNYVNRTHKYESLVSIINVVSLYDGKDYQNSEPLSIILLEELVSERENDINIYLLFYNTAMIYTREDNVPLIKNLLELYDKKEVKEILIAVVAGIIDGFEDKKSISKFLDCFSSYTDENIDTIKSCFLILICRLAYGLYKNKIGQSMIFNESENSYYLLRELDKCSKLSLKEKPIDVDTELMYNCIRIWECIYYKSCFSRYNSNLCFLHYSLEFYLEIYLKLRKYKYIRS